MYLHCCHHLWHNSIKLPLSCHKLFKWSTTQTWSKTLKKALLIELVELIELLSFLLSKKYPHLLTVCDFIKLTDTYYLPEVLDFTKCCGSSQGSSPEMAQCLGKEWWIYCRSVTQQSHRSCTLSWKYQFLSFIANTETPTIRLGNCWICQRYTQSVYSRHSLDYKYTGSSFAIKGTK